MTRTIRIEGYDGVGKVGFTKCLRDLVGMELAHAKAHTDQLLENGAVDIAVNRDDFASTVVCLVEIGARVSAVRGLESVQHNPALQRTARYARRR